MSGYLCCKNKISFLPEEQIQYPQVLNLYLEKKEFFQSLYAKRTGGITESLEM